MDTTTNIFLWTSRFTTIMSQCRASPIISSLVKNSCNRKFANFRDLIQILSEAANGGVLQKRCT